MANNFEHVSHKKSQLTRDIAPKEFYGLTPTANNSDNAGSSPVKLNLAKRPTPEQLIEGEIAVNYLKGHETLTIKNTENEIVGFVNENDFNEAQEVVALGLAQEKNERITDNARFDDKFEEFDKNIDDLELVISSALNDLNSRILDNEDAIEDLSDEIGETIERELTEIVTTINEMTERIDENELAISSSLNDLNTRIVENDEKIAEIGDRLDEFDDGIERIELAVSSSLNDLNTRIAETNEVIDSKYADLTEQVTTLENEVHYNGSGKYIDLGLPSGVLWGRYNLPIAANPTDQYTNLYFAWGETEGYEECEIGVNRTFNDASYKWKWSQIDDNNPTSEPLKYNSTDGKNVLELQNDAAASCWGWSWGLPSKEEVQELIDNTTRTIIEDNGGFVIFTSNINGEKLYVPCAGMASGTNINSGQGEAYFWTRDVVEGNNNTYNAYALYCRGELPSIETIRRDKGLPIRPVTHKRRGQ